jgi:hypothetical protein
MGLVLSYFRKNLLLMYMYTRSSVWLDVNRFFTLLWTNEYGLWFHLHNDVEHICAKMQRAMGASVLPPALIKSHHSCIHKSSSFTTRVSKNDLEFPQNLQNLLKLRHRWLGYELFFTKFCLKPPLHHVGELHPTSMDWKGPLHNVGQSSTSSTSSKIDLQPHLQGLMAIQTKDLMRIKHVILIFSW